MPPGWHLGRPRLHPAPLPASGQSCTVDLGALRERSRLCYLRSKKLDPTQMCAPGGGKDVCEFSRHGHRPQQEGLSPRRGEARPTRGKRDLVW